MNNQNLKQKTFSGFFWTFLEQLYFIIFRNLINILIARKLFPEDYGIFSLVFILIQFLEVFVDAGFKNTIIRKPDLTVQDLVSIFSFNLIISVFFYLILFFISPIIADFFSVEGFAPVARGIGLLIVIHGLGLVQDALINRKIQLKFYAKLNIAATTISGISGIISAYNGMGIWSLVIQTLLRSIILVIFYWVWTDWIPNFKYISIHSFKENFRFSYKLMLSSFINSLFSNLFQLVIGKVYSAESLGYYTQGKRLGEMPSIILHIIFQRTGFPVLSAIHTDHDNFIRVYNRLIIVAAMVAFPITFILLLIGKPIIIIFLTEKWINSIPFYYFMCFSGMFLPIIGISGYAILAKGRSDLVLKYETLYKLLMVLIILVAYRLDIIYMVLGNVILIVFQFLVNVFVSGKIFKIPFKTRFYDIFRIFIISLIISLITYLTTYFIKFLILKITLQLLIYFTLYSIYIFVSYKNLIQEIKYIIFENFKRNI